jgi:IS5 family transposase
MANGIPSSLRQISTTASASPASANAKRDATLRARSTNSSTAAESMPAPKSNEGTSHNCSTPMETYLRLMFLKFRYRLGYEALCREVADSITWRRFCRIPLDGSVPHPTTLMKLTTRCGSAAVDGLNEALLAKAAEAKLLRTNRIRADTTVVAANVAYPTDSGLLAKAVRRIAATGKRIQAAGGAIRATLRDRSRGAGRRAHEIGAKLRTRSAAGRVEAQATVRRVTGELAELAATAVADAQRLLVSAKQSLRRARAEAERLRERGEHDPVAGRRRGRLARAVNDLTELLDATRQIVAQTRQRVAGITPDGATRRVSLHDADARPIVKGRLGRPVEFGHKAQVVDNIDVIVFDHSVEQDNPPDAPQLAPALARVKKRTGRAPHTVTTDRRYGEAKVDQQLTDLGVNTVVITRKGRPSQARRAEEHRKAFRRIVKWRTGSEGRISYLKRAGTAPASTAPKVPGSGPATESSPTTWSRSAPSPGNSRPTGVSPASATTSDTSTRSSTAQFFRSK